MRKIPEEERKKYSALTVETVLSRQLREHLNQQPREVTMTDLIGVMFMQYAANGGVKILFSSIDEMHQRGQGDLLAYKKPSEEKRKYNEENFPNPLDT